MGPNAIAMESPVEIAVLNPLLIEIVLDAVLTVHEDMVYTTLL